MQIFNNNKITNFEESKAIGKFEDSEFYWVGSKDPKKSNIRLFMTKSQMESTKNKSYADTLEFYSAYKK